MVKVKIGDRVYIHGDIANPCHWGTVTAFMQEGNAFQITPDDADDAPYWVQTYMLQDEYKGNGQPRIVTESAYGAWREAQISKLVHAVR